jgi:hypothetical protein
MRNSRRAGAVTSAAPFLPTLDFISVLDGERVIQGSLQIEVEGGGGAKCATRMLMLICCFFLDAAAAAAAAAAAFVVQTKKSPGLSPAVPVQTVIPSFS